MTGSRLKGALALILAVGLGACGHHAPRSFGAAQACPRSDHYQKPRNADDATRIAKRMLTDVFGSPAVLRQEPYRTGLDQDRWVTRGTSPPGDVGYLVVIDAASGCPVHLGRDE